MSELADYAHHTTTGPPDFRMVQRLWDLFIKLASDLQYKKYLWLLTYLWNRRKHGHWHSQFLTLIEAKHSSFLLPPFITTPRVVFRILILWVLIVKNIFIQHPQFFHIVLKCPNIAGANSLFFKIAGAKAPKLNASLYWFPQFCDLPPCMLLNQNFMLIDEATLDEYLQ